MSDMDGAMDVCGRSFAVHRLLGKGKGGYSYLVSDDAGAYVLKQIHHEPCAYYQFGNKLESELRDYQTLKEVGVPMPKLLAVDEGKERILKEYIDGPTIYELVASDKMKTEYISQMEQMCEILYGHGLNIDYYPTNFVVSRDRLYYVDYECNSYMEQWDFAHWGIQYWSKTEAFLQTL